MTQLVENITSVFFTLSAFFLAMFLLSNEFRKLSKRNKRDHILVISESELKNILNESFEITTKMSELTEQRLAIIWEITTLKDKTIERQKQKIRYLATVTETAIKNRFNTCYLANVGCIDLDDLISGKQDVLTIRAESTSPNLFVAQSFNNAVSVVIIELKTKLYDLCHENHFLEKSPTDWDVFIKMNQDSLTYPLMEQLNLYFFMYMNLDNEQEFKTEVAQLVRRFIKDSLDISRLEVERATKAKETLEETKESIKNKILDVQQNKNDDIIEKFSETKKKKKKEK